MGKLGWIATGVVAAIIATVSVVVVADSDDAQAAVTCGVWTRDSSTNTNYDGMQIRVTDDAALVVDPAGSRFGFGATIWRSIVEDNGAATLEVLGSDGLYYAASFDRPDDTTIDLSIDSSGNGVQQSWSTVSELGCTALALADVACGTWTRASSNNTNFDGVQIRFAGSRAVVTDPAGSRFVVGDELWQNITPNGDQATLDVLGSDGNYYFATLDALTNDSLRVEIDSSGSGNEQSWSRVGDISCESSPLSDIACGVWRRASSNNPAIDGVEVRIAGNSAIVTDSAGSWLEAGSVVWKDIVDIAGEFALSVRGSDGHYYGAALSAVDADTLELTIEATGNGTQQTWERVNSVGCETPAELACGVWERVNSSKANFDGMHVRIEGSTARVTDQASSPFVVGTELWRNIADGIGGLELEVRGTDDQYYPAVLSSSGADTLLLSIDVSASGSAQTWVEVDASGCVFAPGSSEIVCGTWTRTQSSNANFDGMSVVVVGDQARVVDPATSRYPIGEVLWRYIADNTDPATLEVRGTDGRYYSADATTTGVGVLEIDIGISASGSSQTWFRVSDVGCGSGTDVLCGSWERTASNNPNFDGMQVVGSGTRALLASSSGSPFAVGDVVWRGVEPTPPTATLEVLGADLNYYGAELTATGLESLRLEIGSSGSGNEQTWEEIDSSDCEQATVTDIVCGTWTRTESNNPSLDGTRVKVRNGQALITFAPEGSRFAVGDAVWRNVIPGFRAISLDVLGTDGNYYPARMTLDGAEQVELVIDSSGVGNRQVWTLTEPGTCDVLEFAACGTWTRIESNNPRMDGMVIRSDSSEAVIISLPPGATGFAVDDIVWRGLISTSDGFDVEVLGTDGNYYPAGLMSNGVDSLTLRINASGTGNEQTWEESGTEGCEFIISDADPLGALTPTSEPTTTRPETSPTSPPETATVSPVLTAANCLPGTWHLDSQPFVDGLFAASGGELPAGASFEYDSGIYEIVMRADGTYTSTRVAWTWRGTVPEGSMLMVFNGVQTGVMTWDDTIVEADEQTNTTEVQMFVDFGGGLQAIPAGSAINTDTLDAAAPYECNGDVLTILADSVTSTWNRQ